MPAADAGPYRNTHQPTHRATYRGTLQTPEGLRSPCCNHTESCIIVIYVDMRPDQKSEEQLPSVFLLRSDSVCSVVGSLFCHQIPTLVPTGNPTIRPTLTPSALPTRAPSQRPTKVVHHTHLTQRRDIVQSLSVHSHGEVLILENRAFSVYVTAPHASSNPPTYPRLGTSLLTRRLVLDEKIRAGGRDSIHESLAYSPYLSTILLLADVSNATPDHASNYEPYPSSDS